MFASRSTILLAVCSTWFILESSAFRSGVVGRQTTSAPSPSVLRSRPPDHSDVEDDAPRRRLVMSPLVATLTLVSFDSPSHAMNSRSRSDGYKVQKTDTEWQSILSSVQYTILRQGGTERPYSSILEGEERPGIYACAGCGTPLFQSSQKFHSGTGWPSFARGMDGVEVDDVNAVMANLAGAELRCRTCGGHLGDVFADGYLFVGTPAFASGKRYCIDGAALVFQPNDGEAPVAGDLTPPKKLPGWLEPPQIAPLS